MLNVSIIGYGYWGEKLARNFQNSSYFDILSISDKKKSNLTLVHRSLPNVECYQNYKRAINNDLLDLIVISTPTSSHFKIAKYALEKSKHILVEKPICMSLKQVKILNKIDKFDNIMREYASIIKFEKKYLMFYNGNNFGEKGIGLAVIDQKNFKI